MATGNPSASAHHEGEGTKDGIWRTISRTFSGGQTAQPMNSSDEEIEPIKKADTWKLMPAVKDAKARDEPAGRRLGVTWKDVTIKGISSDTTFQENAFSQFNIPKLAKESRAPKKLKTIVDASSGCVKPGEMLLVLGRPGSGCTSLLKILANRRKGFAEISGDVNFGSLNVKEAQKYRGQIVMNTEEELFYPTLSVGETMDFATRLKVPEKSPDSSQDRETWRLGFKDFLLESMGIAHTKDTKVGNEYVRGVSGGERKRVSIMETLCCQASLVCWDNSTRGLDASTALEFTRALRSITDVFGTATIVTLYQAGNGIFDLFDKVLVLDGGKQIYYGPANQAKSYMDQLGFICDDAANVSDFLTSVTVPHERKIKPGDEKTFPRDALSLQQAYLQSETKSNMDRELDFPRTPEASQWTKEFCEAVQMDKSEHLPKSSVYTVSFTAQVRASVTRQYQIFWGDKATFLIKQGATLIQALIGGSLFYNAPDNSSGLFSKGGAVFLALLYNSLLALSEVTDSFFGRPILAKHKNFAYFNPAAFCIAQIASDIPILFFQVTVFTVVLYWMTALKATAAAFFTFWFIIYLATFVMTAFFRMIGAAFPNFDAASKVSGFAIGAYVTYTGYQIAKPEMHPWLGWIYWINPLAYGFDALLSNEFKDTTIPCANANLVPNFLPQYQNSSHQACVGVRGSVPFETSVDGNAYLSSLSYSSSHIWRNVGILFAWWILFVAMTVFFTMRWNDTVGSGGTLLIPRENQSKAAPVLRAADEENQINEKEESDTANSSRTTLNGESVPAGAELLRNTSVFTWRNLTYTVKTSSGDRVLLDNVHGYVKPGMLGALMGSSGAGKTTLLDVLAQRKTDGTIRGEILVDGRPLPVSFQRSAGYCEQLDVHEPFATVREALEFSALLRQSRNTPRADKLAYVDTIIDLLELRDIEHTLIGRIGAGLTVEQRKRVTIGTELVSKPSILIFLDEPTSGLDGQAAYSTVRFLRKLADVGQAVLVTVHQPSALLFAQFDSLLLLGKGGKTVYFGDIGDNGNTVKEYFARNDAVCPPTANPAEFMIDVTSGSLSKGRDWNQVWLESPESQQLTKDLDQIITEAAGRESSVKDDGNEFAMPLWDQTKLVTQRMNVALYRNVEYTNNKFALHISSALFNGFSFWMIGNSVTDQQLILFAMFNFIFVAPGVIAQLQPLFIERRDLFEVREKKSKMYSWSAFVTGNVVSEIPYLCICAVLYFVCFYYTCGFTSNSNKAGAVFFVMLIYEMIYTGMGQFVAAYAPNAVFASLVNPLLIGTLVSFCGVLVPYSQIQEFWRYWMYYLNPYNYLMGSLLTFVNFDIPIVCKESEFAIFDPPSGQTCGQYLAAWTGGPGSRTNLTNPDATSACHVCKYQRGSDYLYTVNLNDYYYGWRNAGICVIFAMSSYALVFALMKLRTKQSKKAQ